YSLVPQFMACEPDNFLRAIELLPRDEKLPVEINCGCPTPNGAGKNAGSGVLRDPEYFGRMIERLASRVGAGKLAVKMRLGVDSPEEFPALCDEIAKLPLARLTVHGRTRKERYKGR